MKLINLIPAEFIIRETRFTAAVRIDGKLSHAHIANSARLPGLLKPGRRVWLSEANNLNRRTRYDLLLVDINCQLVSIDSRIPNKLFNEAVRKRVLNEFMYDEIKPEVKLGNSRLDFQLSGSGRVCWVETKSVTLVKDRIAYFPDAPTERGRKHLLELGEAIKNETRSSVVFIVQRSDADAFSPNWKIDPEFSLALITVANLGVEVRAYCCKVCIDEISIVGEIPVNMKGESIFHI